MNTISGIDNLRKDLERQRGNMQGRIAIPVSDKFGERTIDRLREDTEKAEFADGSYRNGRAASTDAECKPPGDEGKYGVKAETPWEKRPWA